ncbi:TPA: hypothetical protein L9139_002303 [Klebsiella pneumoniae]|nr:hypothetical protein [Klebsiella pneumoniae]
MIMVLMGSWLYAGFFLPAALPEMTVLDKVASTVKSDRVSRIIIVEPALTMGYAESGEKSPSETTVSDVKSPAGGSLRHTGMDRHL